MDARIPRARGGALVVAAALLAGCGPPAAPVVQLPAPTPAPIASATLVPSAAPSATATKAPPRSAYIGYRAGLHLPEIPMAAKLPPELAFQSALELGARPDAAQILTAKRGEDLLMLLTNRDGVVIDVVEVPGVARGFELVAGCRGASGFVDAALVPAPCTADVTVTRTWNVHDGKLGPASKPAQCACIPP